MKRIVLTAVLVLSISSVSFASPGGTIGVYSDAAGTHCYYTPLFGVGYLYIVHSLIPSATASQFKVDYSQVLDPYISETLGAGLLGLGSSGTGIGISYAGCVPSPLLLLTLTFFDQLLTPPCARVAVVPDPAAPTGTIEVVDCNAIKLVGGGGWLYWGGEPGCGTCQVADETEPSSWGKLKSLYRE